MNLLAIDPGTHCGWASFHKGHVESGVHHFDLGRGDSPGMRFLRFRNWLADMLTMTAPELVVYERPHVRGGFATDLLVGFATRIQEACAERGIECEAVHSATLKKGVCGTGRADKAMMIRCASENFGKPVMDDNEADALGLLWIAMKENKPDLSRLGAAGPGPARLRGAGLGEAGRGKVGNHETGRGQAGNGAAGQGETRHGEARRG